MSGDSDQAEQNVYGGEESHAEVAGADANGRDPSVEQHPVGPDRSASPAASSSPREPSQNPEVAHEERFGDGGRAEQDEGGRNPDFAQRRSKSALDFDTTPHDQFRSKMLALEVKVRLLPCLLGLRAAVAVDVPQQELMGLKLKVQGVIDFAIERKADAPDICRCYYYKALVNLAIGPKKDEPREEDPVYLFDEATRATGCIESVYAEQWLQCFQEAGKRQQLEHKPGMIRRAASLLSSPTKEGQHTPDQPLPGLLGVFQGLFGSVPDIMRQSSRTAGQHTARTLSTPGTPNTDRTSSSSSASGSGLSVLSHLSNVSGEALGEALGDYSPSGWQSQSGSRHGSSDSDASSTANSPSRVAIDPFGPGSNRPDSPRRLPPPARHSGDAAPSPGSAAPQSPPPEQQLATAHARGTLGFPGGSRDGHGGTSPPRPDPSPEDPPPPPPVTPTKAHHRRSKSLAISLTGSPTKIRPSAPSSLEDFPPPRRLSIARLLSLSLTGIARSEAHRDPHDEAEKGSPLHATFAEGPREGGRYRGDGGQRSFGEDDMLEKGHGASPLKATMEGHEGEEAGTTKAWRGSTW